MKKDELVKVLARGDLQKPLNIEAHHFSRAAIEKITKTGGKAVELLADDANNSSANNS